MTENNDMSQEWQGILEALREKVYAEMQTAEMPQESVMEALARDYRSFQRMEHAPRQARQLAEQIAFQQRWYLDEEDMTRLGLAVTGMLAELYETKAQSGQ